MLWVEAKSRILLIALATASLISACAPTRNTTAQDLAWERWKQCDHFADVRLNDIRPDGAISITVKTAAMGGMQQAAAWKQCIEEAASVQGQRTAGLNARRGAAPPVAPGLPVWRRGDEWTYRWAGPDGSGTDVWSVDREEVVDGIDCYVTRSGQREIFHRKADLASVKETFGGEPASRYSPPRLNYVWPLAIGKSWEQSFTEERRGEKQTHVSRWSWEIEREESVTVPAGTFRTVKITIRDARNAAVVSESWYAPAARLPVRVVQHLPKGRSESELIRFRIE
jgi:hypothetical protein